MGELLTPKDVEKIEAELRHRKLEVRTQALDDLKEAAAQGDRSENFEYTAAKRFKNQNESRIRYLERVLKTAKVISIASKPDEVGVNDVVKVEFEEDGSVEYFKIVTSIRSNSLEGRVSIESPVGKALLRHKVGDMVTVEVNESYSYELTIMEIDKTAGEPEEINAF